MRGLTQQPAKLSVMSMQQYLPHELLQADCMPVRAQRARRHLVVELLPAPNWSSEQCLFDVW